MVRVIKIRRMMCTRIQTGWMSAAIAIATGGACVEAQTPSVLDPFTYEFVDYKTPDEWVRFTRTLDVLSAMRVEGIDPERASDSTTNTPTSTSTLIGFDGTVIENAYAPRIDSIASLADSADSSLRFRVDRNTTLIDGGIGGGSLTSPENSNVASLTQGSGTYNLTDMELQWSSGSEGPFDVVFLSGITAIEAQRVSLGEARDSSEIQRQVIAVPTIGSAVRWDISDSLSFSGQATTQSLDLGSSLLGFQAKTDWRLSDRVGLSAGYQIIRSEFDLGTVSRDLSQEGLFARLQIKF